MSADWTARPMLALDTETTGVDCWNDRIVQVAAVEIDLDGNATDPWSTIVNPGIDIPDEAAQVHGIPTSRAVAEGVDPAEALSVVADRIFAHGWRCPVVMFNARFDWPLLIAEAERHGVEFPAFAPILDPYLIDRMVDKYRKGKRQLTLVADHYGVELGDDAHDATADAIAAGRVMRQLLARYPQIGDHSLADLFVRQIKGHEQWREGFVDFKRRSSDPSFDMAPGWPIPAGAVT